MAKYKRTTAQERKMAVKLAKEVLAVFNSKVAPKAKPGVYVGFNQETACDLFPENVTELDLKETLTQRPKFAKSCMVCALGAMYLAKVRLFNEVALRFVPKGEYNQAYAYIRPANATNAELFSLAESVRAIIGRDNAHQIEAAFEKFDRHTHPAAYRFGSLYRSPKARLMAIMENVLEHNGEFTPEAALPPVVKRV